MSRMLKIIPALAITLVACNFGLGSSSAVADENAAAARQATILANLKLQFPQLETMNPVMGEIKSSGITGLDEGTFIVGGRQTQAFLVTADNKRFWMVAGPAIDVSKSAEQIANEVKNREAKELEEAKTRAKELETAIAGLPHRGNASAPVTIVEFSDFQCPYCTKGAEVVEQLVAKYPNDIKFVFKHFPLNFHPWAMPAAIAANCASTQKPEAFWALHDAYFEHQKEITPQNVIDKSREYLAASGIDMAKFVACAEDKDTPEYKTAAAAVGADMQLGGRLGVSGTPGFFVNGIFINGALPLEEFEKVITKVKAN
jgi:protein-disulfide isomerase